MVTTRLDPIDRKILSELQADGRMTNVELARRVGISAPPCLRRVRSLEEAGLIRGYHAEIDTRVTDAAAARASQFAQVREAAE